MARTGRRKGRSGTKEAILTAARTAFAERGFDATSLRTIATAAGVDPALIHHYFGNKDQLFLAAMHAPIDPGEVVPQVIAEGVDHIGERLVDAFIGVWDSPAGTVGAALLRSAVNDERSARLLRDFLTTQVLRRVAQAVDLPDAPRRLPLIASQMMGLAMTRYLLPMEPLASAPRSWLTATIGPTVQQYITMDLPPLPTSDQ